MTKISHPRRMMNKRMIVSILRDIQTPPAVTPKKKSPAKTTIHGVGQIGEAADATIGTAP
jgi:hypothetical protein